MNPRTRTTSAPQIIRRPMPPVNVTRHQYNIWRSESQPVQYHEQVQGVSRYTKK